MTHIYNITGMTCTGCQAKVQYLLSKIAGVKNVRVDLEKGEATIEMDQHIPTETLKSVLSDFPKYQLSEKKNRRVGNATEEQETRSWFATYKPILLIFGYITIVSLIAASSGNSFNVLLAMRIFMSGFFLVFSFFKMLDIEGFADSYSMYDIVAKKFKAWGIIYVFTELALGISFALNFQPFITNMVTLVIMTISLVGVLQSVLNKQKIQCACLGAVFDLPMSSVTIIEDALMIVMSGVMLIVMH